MTLRQLASIGAVSGVLALGGPGVVIAGQDRGDARAQGQMRAYRPAVPGTHGAVTSAHPLASMAGVQVLLNGGNAPIRAARVTQSVGNTDGTDGTGTKVRVPDFRRSTAGCEAAGRECRRAASV